MLGRTEVRSLADFHHMDEEGEVLDAVRGQGEWLACKLSDAAQRRSPVARAHAPIHSRKGEQQGKVAVVTFEGLLSVHDPRSLLTHRENGIDHAKACGCGSLLLVRRVG